MVRLLIKKVNFCGLAFYSKKYLLICLKFFFLNNSIIWGERGFKVCLSFKEEKKLSVELQFTRLLTFMKD